MDRRLEHHFLRFRRKCDPKALAKVFDLSSAELATIARQLVRDASTAEDVVQQTYLTAIEKAHVFDESQKVMPWLVGILARHAAQARAAARRAPDPERLDPQEVPDPAQDAQSAEIGSMIDDRIDELPDAYAPAVRSYLTEGLRPKEIARRLGISANAASVRVHRGLKLLRKRLPVGSAPAIALAMPDMTLVREQVLAAVPSSPVAAAAAATAGSSAAGAAGAAGLLTMKKSLLLVAGGALLGSGTTHVLQDVLRPAPTPGSDEVAAATPDEPTAPELELPTVEPQRRAPAPTVDPELAPEPAPRTADEWLARINGADDHGEAKDVYRELAAIDADEGLRILREIWSRIEDTLYRLSALEVFPYVGHRHAVEILHLAATDASIDLQIRAIEELSTIALRPFESDYDAYLSWHTTVSDQPFDDIVRSAGAAFASRMAALSGPAILAELEAMDSPDFDLAEAAGVDLPAILRGAGFADSLERLLAMDDNDAQIQAIRWGRAIGADDRLRATLDGWLDAPDAEKQAVALRWIDALSPDEEYLRDRVLPIVEGHANRDPRVVDNAVRLLGRDGNDWAIDALLDVLLNPHEGTSRFFGTSRALAKIGDPRVIPTMIAVIGADDTYDSKYGVGYFGLERLTGVPYDESHDGAFWVAWWSANRGRFPAPASGMSIPFVSFDD